MKIIDAHMHYPGDHEDCVAVLDDLDIKAMNICLAYGPGGWNDQRETYRRLSERYPQRFAWCTTFDPPDYTVSDAGYADRVVARLEQDIRDGATACKVWKNIGMEVRKPNGEYLMLDDAIFRPIFDFLERSDLPVLMHIGEPLEWWKPLDPSSPHYDYLTEEAPEWYAYPKENYPSHGELMRARDAVVARYRRIRFIGAHLGSLEYDLQVLAQTLERLPNFVVDTSARIEDLGVLHAPEDVHDFMEKYSERVIYGSDMLITQRQSAVAADERKRNAKELREAYAQHWRYLTTSDRFRYLGHDIQGIELSEDSLGQIMLANAQACYGL